MVILNKGTKLDFWAELVVEHVVHGPVFLQILHDTFLQRSDGVNLLTDPYHDLRVLIGVRVTEAHSFFLLFVVIVPCFPLAVT